MSRTRHETEHKVGNVEVIGEDVNGDKVVIEVVRDNLDVTKDTVNGEDGEHSPVCF